MKTRTTGTSTSLERRKATALLNPIAAFLSSVGMTKAESLAALAAAIDDVRKSERRRKLERIGTPTCYLDLIGAWSREHKFLDSQGRPRPLSLSGANGFTALVKSIGGQHNPKKLLDVLVRYKNVKRLTDGRIQLVSPLFRASAGSRIAFEPIARFLNDATSTLTHTLMRVSASTNPDLFWRTVENIHVSRADTAKFMEFAKERSLLFLEELDDWLSAHGTSRTRSSKRPLRVGLGVFSIYSNRTAI